MGQILRGSHDHPGRDDLIMMGIGAFSPLKASWEEGTEGRVEGLKLTGGVFWPIPITLSV
jgi:ATP sulfurylase